MDECTDIATSDAPGKNFRHFPGSPTAAALDLNCQNPFDRQFELARKQNINLRYAPSISNLNQTSPLNTPSISLNEGATPWIPLPTPMVVPTSSIAEPESLKVAATAAAAPAEETQPISKVGSNQRSNVVSVICPPSATSAKSSDAQSFESASSTSTSDSDSNSPVNLTVKSAPVITTRVETPQYNHPKASVPKSAPELTCLRSYPRKNKLLAPITLLVSLPKQETPLSPPPKQVVGSSRLHSESEKIAEAWSPRTIKIVPKRDNGAQVNSISASAKSRNSISSLVVPSRKKEKTEEELLSRLKATEAALPPKAKPGRKKRSAAEQEDARERKRRSLERNRAAAMRCRLKKKKEVDQLKIKVEELEEQNKGLKRIIDDLYKEVRQLKSELMLHKDCKQQ